MKVDWGKKIECSACGTMFYDMRKKDPICPSCGQKVKPMDFKKKKRETSKTEDSEIEKELKTNFDFLGETFDDPEDPDEIEGIDKYIEPR